MMKSKAICCDECFHSIASSSTSAARLWIELCSIPAYSAIMDNDFPELTLLETMGFITTIEDPHYDEGLLVRVNGHQSFYFCRGKCA